MKKIIMFWIGLTTILTLAWCGMQSMNRENMWSTSMDHWMMNKSNNTSTSILQSDNDTMLAQASKVIILKDGDIYDMTVTKVLKEIGNATIPMLAYNGSIPWPLLKIEKWATVTLRFTNKVKEIETLLHSHGVRVDNTMDGVARSMWWHQDPVKYWETFEYKLTFPDEGIFRYHPHVQEELQQELGLYGNYLVNDSSKKALPVNKEEALILDDILLEDEKVPAFLKNWVNYSLMGRYGNVMLINGTTNYNLTLKQWEVVRLYLTNVSNTRPYNITIPWAKIKLVGWDIGYYEHETMIDNLIIWPAERYIVDIMIDKAWSYNITNQTPEKSTTLWTIQVSNDNIADSFTQEFNILQSYNEVITDMSAYKTLIDAPIQKSLNMTIDMMGMNMWWMQHGWHGSKQQVTPIEREDNNMMNANSNGSMTKWKLIDTQTKKENMDINWLFNKWDKVKIRITNDANSMHPMQHPIHFHGQRFLVVSKNWAEQINLVWKDTALIPAWEYVDIILDASNPGTWMSHCHIAEHLSAGMMMKFEVK